MFAKIGLVLVGNPVGDPVGKTVGERFGSLKTVFKTVLKLFRNCSGTVLELFENGLV